MLLSRWHVSWLPRTQPWSDSMKILSQLHSPGNGRPAHQKYRKHELGSATKRKVLPLQMPGGGVPGAVVVVAAWKNNFRTVNCVIERKHRFYTWWCGVRNWRCLCRRCGATWRLNCCCRLRRWWGTLGRYNCCGKFRGRRGTFWGYNCCWRRPTDWEKIANWSFLLHNVIFPLFSDLAAGGLLFVKRFRHQPIEQQ